MINEEKNPLDLENIKISHVGENVLLSVKDNKGKTGVILNKKELNRLVELLLMFSIKEKL